MHQKAEGTNGKVPARSEPAPPAPNSRQQDGNEESKATFSESDLDSDSEDDNEWSHDDGLEGTIIAAVGGNLALASYLIPIIHKTRNAEYVKMIHAWQDATLGQHTTQCTPGGNSSENQHRNHHASPTFTSSSTGEYGGSSGGRSGGGGSPYKKRKRSNSNDSRRQGDGGKDDDEGMGGSGGDGASPSGTGPGVLLLACPFHKKDPIKYSQRGCTTGGKKRGSFRACAGPGWKSIQRLK